MSYKEIYIRLGLVCLIFGIFLGFGSSLYKDISEYILMKDITFKTILVYSIVITVFILFIREWKRM